MTPSDDDVAGAQTNTSAAPATSSPASRRPGATARRASMHALAAGHRLHEFELTEHIGEGGFSIVYRAWDQSLERVVALKEYMPGSLAVREEDTRVSVRDDDMQATFDAGLRSFVNESKLLASFDHPSLVKVYRFWEANGTAYMVMPFYEGLTLRDTVQAMPGRPSQDWILDVLDPLTEALTYIHQRSCYHRDIAPDNILMLADSGRPLLLDFGAARRVITDLSQQLTVIVKAGYAPIEQYGAMPDAAQGPWTDVHALAAVIYWMVTGEKPPAAISRVLRDTYVPLADRPPPGYSLDFLRAIDRGLALRPEDRTQSIAAFAEQLGLHPATTTATVSRPRPPVPVHVTVAPYPPTVLQSQTAVNVALDDPGAVTAIQADDAPADAADDADDEETRVHPAAGVSYRPEPATAPPMPTAAAAAPVAMPAPPPLRPVAAVDAPPPAPAVIRPAPTAPAPSATPESTPTPARAAAPEPVPVSAAPTGGRRSLPWVLGGVVVAAAAAAGAWFLQHGAGPATTTPAPQPASAAATAPAPPPPASAAALPAEVPSAPATAPMPVETPAAPPPAAAAPVPAPLPARAPAAARVVPAKERNAPERRASAPVSTNTAECARLLQRLSLGESSPDLLDRAANLHCK